MVIIDRFSIREPRTKFGAGWLWEGGLEIIGDGHHVGDLEVPGRETGRLFNDRGHNVAATVGIDHDAVFLPGARAEDGDALL